MARIVTIGVYGWTSDAFLDALGDARTRLVLDVRQRRGVRGSEYAWANAKRLEAALAAAGFDYEHRIDLAPSTELRQVQYREDDCRGVGKRSRAELADEYRRRYASEILDGADLRSIGDGSALLCVERDAEACHRSLIADRLAERHGARIVHLMPPP